MANYQSQTIWNKMLVIRSHLNTENNLKVEKRYIISKTSTTVHPRQKTLGVRVETNIPKISKAIIKLALSPEGVYCFIKAMKLIRQCLETRSLEWVNDHSGFNLWKLGVSDVWWALSSVLSLWWRIMIDSRWWGKQNITFVVTWIITRWQALKFNEAWDVQMW